MYDPIVHKETIRILEDTIVELLDTKKNAILELAGAYDEVNLDANPKDANQKKLQCLAPIKSLFS